MYSLQYTHHWFFMTTRMTYNEHKCDHRRVPQRFGGASHEKTWLHLLLQQPKTLPSPLIFFFILLVDLFFSFPPHPCHIKKYSYTTSHCGILLFAQIVLNCILLHFHTLGTFIRSSSSSSLPFAQLIDPSWGVPNRCRPKRCGGTGPCRSAAWRNSTIPTPKRRWPNCDANYCTIR